MTTPRITLIAAICSNGAIGRRGDMIHYISGDLRRFRLTTTGHTVVMGRHTFLSLPKGPLPNRRNIVVSRQGFTTEGIDSAANLPEAIAMATEAGETDIYVIGGAQLYATALPMADVLDLTLIDDSPTDADTFFPAINPDEWHTASASEPITDERSGMRYSYVRLERGSRPATNAK